MVQFVFNAALHVPVSPDEREDGLTKEQSEELSHKAGLEFAGNPIVGNASHESEKFREYQKDCVQQIQRRIQGHSTYGVYSNTPNEHTDPAEDAKAGRQAQESVWLWAPESDEIYKGPLSDVDKGLAIEIPPDEAAEQLRLRGKGKEQRGINEDPNVVTEGREEKELLPLAKVLDEHLAEFDPPEGYITLLGEYSEYLFKVIRTQAEALYHALNDRLENYKMSGSPEDIKKAKQQVKRFQELYDVTPVSFNKRQDEWLAEVRRINSEIEEAKQRWKDAVAERKAIVTPLDEKVRALRRAYDEAKAQKKPKRPKGRRRA